MSINISGSNPTATRASAYLGDGTNEYRIIIRNGKLYTDKLKSGGTWEQAEGVGWIVVGMLQ